jgi:hypothetical protein
VHATTQVDPHLDTFLQRLVAREQGARGHANASGAATELGVGGHNDEAEAPQQPSLHADETMAEVEEHLLQQQQQAERVKELAAAAALARQASASPSRLIPGVSHAAAKEAAVIDPLPPAAAAQRQAALQLATTDTLQPAAPLVVPEQQDAVAMEVDVSATAAAALGPPPLLPPQRPEHKVGAAIIGNGVGEEWTGQGRGVEWGSAP